jgi:hypothetical protein
VDCGLVPANNFVGVSAQFSVDNTIPGPGHFSDDCGGGDFDLDANVVNFGRGWQTPVAPGRICTTTIGKSNIQGDTMASARYQLR